MPGETATAEELLAPLGMFRQRQELEPLRNLLASLGNPHRFTRIVLVAGTNGKGSTAALLASMSTAAGYRTGLFTSPHLETVHERIRIDGRAIDDVLLVGWIREIFAKLKRLRQEKLTFFETLAAAAFCHFALQRIELAVMEVGLGGRLDATNVAEPALSLITRIALDHTQYLGDTTADIVREKAGILRSGRRALAWVGDEEAEAALATRAEEMSVPLEMAKTRIRMGIHERRADGTRLRLVTPHEFHELDFPFPGEHQLPNLVLAVRAAEILARDGWPLMRKKEVIARGVGSCFWPGRLEWVTPPGRGPILLDGAHNPDSAEALARYLADLDRPYDLLFGALEDKDVSAMLPPLAAAATEVTVTTTPVGKGIPAAQLALLIGDRSCAVEPDADAALARALAPGERLLVICGSLYLMGHCRLQLRRRYGTPAPALAAISSSKRRR